MANPASTVPDFIVTNHGTIFLVEPQHDAARTFLLVHVAEDAQWFGGSLVVEHRYAEGFCQALHGDDFTVEVR